MLNAWKMKPATSPELLLNLSLKCHWYCGLLATFGSIFYLRKYILKDHTLKFTTFQKQINKFEPF